jgi:hypothetical protein
VVATTGLADPAGAVNSGDGDGDGVGTPPDGGADARPGETDGDGEPSGGSDESEELAAGLEFGVTETAAGMETTYRLPPAPLADASTTTSWDLVGELSTVCGVTRIVGRCRAPLLGMGAQSGRALAGQTWLTWAKLRL